MAITSYSQKRFGSLTEVTVVSDLVGTVFYHWYVDGMWVGTTSAPVERFFADAAEQIEIICQDTLDPTYDPLAHCPAGGPARRTIWWLRSLAADVAAYRVEQQKDGGSWVILGTVPRAGEAWEYSFKTDPLDDLTTYAWRVIPLDAVGNEGTALEVDVELIVRRPDAPAFTVTFDPETSKVTFAS